MNISVLFLAAPLAAATLSANTPIVPDRLTTIPFVSLTQRIVDHRGVGPDGRDAAVVNLRAVLPGLVYRAGASEAFSRRRSALSLRALISLCEEGFYNAYFLYNDRLPASSINCDRDGAPATLQYLQTYASGGREAENRVLEAIYTLIISDRNKPMLLQDYAGLHAAGYISAIALRQFCGMGPKSAVEYWRATANGTGLDDYPHLVRKIREFALVQSYQIPDERVSNVCPPVGAD